MILPTVNRLRDCFYLLLIMALAVLLRAPLMTTGITIDDACSAFVVEASNWSDMVERIRTIEMSPPFYFIVLKAVVSLFGLTTPVLALTSLILSVLCVPLTYLLGRSCLGLAAPADDSAAEKQASENTASAVGLTAAFFSTVSLLSIIYSHEARTYALAAFLFTSALLFYVPFFDGQASRKRQMALFVTSALLTYTHYTAVPYLCIMTLTAIIYRRRQSSRSLAAIPPMMAGIASIIPWYPVLKYHGSVGTPWADAIPLSQFPSVLAGNLASTSPLPVVPSYLFVTLALPLLCGLWIVLKPGDFKQRLLSLINNPKLLTMAILLFYSASVFGYITPYIFGYVRYMVPVAVTAWVLLATLLVNLAAGLTARNKKVSFSPRFKRGVVLLLVMMVAAVNAQAVGLMSAQDRSGLRRLARDIALNRFKGAAFITTPDFVGIILVYYLKHECGIAAAGLPRILGFAYPQGGILPPKHDGRAACWLNPHLIDDYQAYIDQLQKEGATQIVLVRDTYSPNSKQMPTGTKSDDLQKMLATKLVPVGASVNYPGYASTYMVTRYAFPPTKGKQ